MAGPPVAFTTAIDRTMGARTRRLDEPEAVPSPRCGSDRSDSVLGDEEGAMPFVSVLGNDVHYIDEGDGQSVVFIHGFGGCAEGWYQQMEALSPRYRVLAYDSVNHGHS